MMLEDDSKSTHECNMRQKKNAQSLRSNNAMEELIKEPISNSPHSSDVIIAEFMNSTQETDEMNRDPCFQNKFQENPDDAELDTPLQIVAEIMNHIDNDNLINSTGSKILVSLLNSKDMTEFSALLLQYIRNFEHYKTITNDRILAIEKKVDVVTQIFFVFCADDYYFFGSGTFSKKDSIKKYGGVWGSFLKNETHTTKAWRISENAVNFMNELSDVRFVYDSTYKIGDIPEEKNLRIKKF